MRAEENTISERSTAAAALASAAAVVGFAAAIFVAGQVRIPLGFTPVPITLQTFAVYLGAAWLGPVRGVGGPLLFAAAAVAGMPVRSGFQAGLTGATAGYILGWLLAAYLLGRTLGGKAVPMGRIVALMIGASALVYACGVLHFTLLLRVPLTEALWMGMLPFLPGDALKIAAAAAAYRRWPRVLASL